MFVAMAAQAEDTGGDDLPLVAIVGAAVGGALVIIVLIIILLLLIHYVHK